MNNDLISREALKEDFKSRLALCNDWIEKAKDKETKIRASAVKAFIGEVIMTIDNAPSVNVKDQIAGAYNEGYMCGNKEAEKARPQGEWIKITKNGTIPVEYICSVCGRKIFDNYELSVPQSVYYPFCHCGADMRGGVV